MKKIFGMMAGVLVAMLLVAAIDTLADTLFPGGEIDAADPATLTAYVADLPIAAKLIVTTGWLIAPLAGAWLSLRIADWKPGGWIVTAVFLVGALLNQYTLPHPVWMQICAIILPLAGGWVAQRLHRKPYPGEPLLG